MKSSLQSSIKATKPDGGDEVLHGRVLLKLLNLIVVMKSSLAELY